MLQTNDYTQRMIPLLVISAFWVALISLLVNRGYIRDPYILLFIIPGALAELMLISRWLYRKYGKEIWLLGGISFMLCAFKIFNQLVLHHIFNRLFWDTFLYFGAGIYLLYKRKPLSIAETGLLLFIPCMMLFLPMLSMGTEPDVYPLLFTPVLAWTLLYLYYRARRYRAVYFLLILFFIGLLSFLVYPNYWSYLNGTTHISSVGADRRTMLKITGPGGDTTTLARLSGIVVIDTWFTHCNACFKRFSFI